MESREDLGQEDRLSTEFDSPEIDEKLKSAWYWTYNPEPGKNYDIAVLEHPSPECPTSRSFSVEDQLLMIRLRRWYKMPFHEIGLLMSYVEPNINGPATERGRVLLIPRACTYSNIRPSPDTMN